MSIDVSVRPQDKLFTRDFVILATAAMSYYMAFGASLPLIPAYVKSELGGSPAMVGIVAGSFAFSAVFVRPGLGRFGDRRGRKLLVIGGGVLTGIAYVGHVFAVNVPLLILFRLLVGAGQGAVMIGATSLAVDMAPAHRRGEAASYMLVAFQLGMGLGPFSAELLVDHTSYNVAWLCCAACALACAAIASLLPTRVVAGIGAVQKRRFLHPAAIRPGLVIGLGVFGFAGFNAFLKLFGHSVGMDSVGLLFLILSGTTIAGRLVGARLPDRLGPGVGGALALGCIGVGTIAIGLLKDSVALYLLTFVVGVGAALMFPCLSVGAINDVAENERSASLATFTMFMDVFAGLSALSLGWVAGATSYATMYVIAGCVAITGACAAMMLLRPEPPMGKI
jgi:MFS family permease